MQRLRLNVLLLAMGSAAMAAQILCLRRLISVFGGNELVSGAVFAGWLLWSGVGNVVAGRFADRLRDPQRSSAILLGAMALVIVLTVAAAALVKAAMGISPPVMAPLPAIVAATLLLMAPLGFLIGASFTVVCRLPEAGGAQAIGRVYALDAIGCGIGGLLFSLVAIRLFSPVQAALLIAAVLIAAVGIAFPRRALEGSALVAVAALAALAWFAPQLEAKLARLQWAGFDPVAFRESLFGSLMVTEGRGERTLFVDGRPAFSLPNPASYETAAHLPLLEHPRPREVLIVGGGIFGMIAPWSPWELDRAHFAQLDPDVTGLEQSAMPSGLNALPPWAAIHHGDGRRLIREGIGSCREACLDVIIIAVGDPDTAAAARYFTAEFFAEAARALRPGGVIALSLLEPANVVGAEQAAVLGTVFAALARAFPHIAILPFERFWFVASGERGWLTESPDELARRLDERGIAAPSFRDRELAGIFSERIASTRREIERAAAAASPTTDAKPLASHAGMMLWERRSGEARGGVVAALAMIRPWMAAAATALLALLSIALGRRGAPSVRARVSATWILAAIGFASMAGELALLVGYQMSEGLLVWRIGFIVTAFMVGAGAGAAAVAWRLGTRAPSPQLLFLAILLFAGLMPNLFVVAGASFLLANGMLGVISGIVYQLATARLVESGRGTGAAAGIVESADHGGAALGALAASIAIIPLFGLEAALLAGGAALLAAAIVGVALDGARGLPTQRGSQR